MSSNESDREDVLKSLVEILIKKVAKLKVHDRVAESCLVALVVLLKDSKPSKMILNFVADRLLAIYQDGSSKRRMFLRNSPALKIAIDIIPLGVEPVFAEAVIQEDLKNGWLWLCTGDCLAEKLLKRKLKAEEVSWLIDNYIANKAVQSDETESTLNSLAVKYMSSIKDIDKVSLRLKNFREESRRNADAY
jgi:hypothetical protein